MRRRGRRDRRPSEPRRLVPAREALACGSTTSARRGRRDARPPLRRRDGCAASVAPAIAAVAALAVGVGGGIAGRRRAAQRRRVAGLSAPPAPRADRLERIYFVMPDRYANGDPVERPRRAVRGPRRHRLRPGRLGLVPRRRLPRADPRLHRHARGLARMKDLGFTAVWVTPPFASGPCRPSSAAYHGYWGSATSRPSIRTSAPRPTSPRFVDCAHRLGLKVYLDVVVNHTADVILPHGGSAVSAREDNRTATAAAAHPARYVRGALPVHAGGDDAARAARLPPATAPPRSPPG